MKFFIDRLPTVCEPRAIDIIPAGFEENRLPAGQRIFVESQVGVDIEAIFGLGGLAAGALKDLELLRGRTGLHMITFENLECDQLTDLLVHMPKVPRTFLGRGDLDYAYAETTIRFSQVNPNFILNVLEWVYISDGAPLAIGDGKWKIHMPAAGRFLSNGLSGYSPGLAGGAGEELEIQLRNSTQGLDYLTTTGKFKINSATGRLEDQVYSASRSFVKNDIIEVDFDAVPVWTPAVGETVFIIQAFAEMYGPGPVE